METPADRGHAPAGAFQPQPRKPGARDYQYRPAADPVKRAAAVGHAFLIFGLLLGTLGGAGCARLAVTSTPPGADVLWSPDGLKPWRPWPPRYWSGFTRTHEDKATTVTTPLSQTGPQADYLFVTVRKPGYYHPLPQLVGMRMFHTCKLQFDLRETPEHYAERQRAAGLVLYQGNWVDPRKNGLVEYRGEWIPEAERTRRIMAARGLVEFEGKWVTRQEYEVLYTNRQRARGLIEFKDRWVKPAVKSAEETIDKAVQRCQAAQPPEMFPPKVLGRIEGNLTGLGLVSTAKAPTRWLISGPTSRWLDLPPEGQIEPRSFRLPPGRYTVAIFQLPPEGTKAGEKAGKASTPPTTVPSVPGMPFQPPHPLIPPKIADAKGLTVLIAQPLSAGFQYSLSYSPPGTQAAPPPPLEE